MKTKFEFEKILSKMKNFNGFKMKFFYDISQVVYPKEMFNHSIKQKLHLVSILETCYFSLFL